MASPPKGLPVDVDPQEHLSTALRDALRAWGRGEMTPNQQRGVLGWIMGDLCQCGAIDPPEQSERMAGYTAGQRRVGMVIARCTGVRLRLPNDEEPDA